MLALSVNVRPFVYVTLLVKIISFVYFDLTVIKVLWALCEIFANYIA